MKTLEIMNSTGCDRETAITLKDLAIQAQKKSGMTSKEAFDMLMGSIEKIPSQTQDAYDAYERMVTMDIQSIYEEYGKAIGMTTDELKDAQRKQAIVNHILDDQ